MYGFTADTGELGDALLWYSENRMRLEPVPLDGSRTLEELQAVAGNTITAEGMGAPRPTWMAASSRPRAATVVLPGHPRDRH